MKRVASVVAAATLVTVTTVLLSGCHATSVVSSDSSKPTTAGPAQKDEPTEERSAHAWADRTFGSFFIASCSTRCRRVRRSPVRRRRKRGRLLLHKRRAGQDLTVQWRRCLQQNPPARRLHSHRHPACRTERGQLPPRNPQPLDPVNELGHTIFLTLSEDPQAKPAGPYEPHRIGSVHEP